MGTYCKSMEVRNTMLPLAACEINGNECDQRNQNGSIPKIVTTFMNKTLNIKPLLEESKVDKAEASVNKKENQRHVAPQKSMTNYFVP